MQFVFKILRVVKYLYFGVQCPCVTKLKIL